MRSMSAGTQPMPPSEMAILSLGKRTGTFENSQSLVVMMDPTKNREVTTSGGASDEPVVTADADPTCSERVVPVSSQALNSGSQYPVWMLGSLSFSGISGKDSDLKPSSALRRTSAAAISTSLSQVTCGGMKRSG